jgi:hypothetical protein
MRWTAGMVGSFAAAGLASHAAADAVYVFQDRSIAATTSYNNNVQSTVAPTFAPFVQNLDLVTEFPIPGGGTATNRGRVGIDCQLDPNAIRVSGSLTGAGGLAVVGGGTALQFGEATARVDVRFRLDEATPYTMLATPRPSTRAGDRFKIKLKNETTSEILFLLDETMPVQAVNVSATLPAGEFELEYQVELTVDGPETLRDFEFRFLLPGSCQANCDGSTTPPVLNVADFVCFQSRFAAGEPYADCDRSGALNVLDFVCFQTLFAAGCSAP